MATSDSEDFESADEELEEGIEIVKKDCMQNPVPVNPETVTTAHTADKPKTLASGDNNTEIAISDITKSLGENAYLEETEPKVIQYNTYKSLNEAEIGNKICKPEMSFQKEYKSKIECEKTELLTDVGEGNSTISDSKEVKQKSNADEDLTREMETDGWDCEDEDVSEQLTEETAAKKNLNTALDKLSESVGEEQQFSSNGGSNSWGSWGSWGVTSLLSTATESVNTLTNQVSHGFSSVLETGLGVPDPEELARQEIEQEKKFLSAVKENSELNSEERKEEENSVLFGFGRVMSGVSSITKLVETASTKVVSGGLGTLETIGKKTMEVLQEGDPGLRKKRALFSEKVVLSQILREAKDKAEQEDRALKNNEEARKVHFETLFDDCHGLVHLEALEMLSKQCNIKLQSVLINTPPSDVSELQESIAEIKDICQLPDEEDVEGASFETLKTRLAGVGKELGVPIANEKLVKTWEEVHQWLQECRSTTEDLDSNVKNSSPTAQAIHQKAIATLAKLTAEAVEQFHKTAELLLVYEKRNPDKEAKVLLDMTSVFSLQVSTVATMFSVNLNTSSEYAENSDAVNSLITNVFLEAANSSSYIQEAFQLLIPVLQVGIISS